ncbi:hypothetical protein BGZ81_004732 [Podila clonocystis]|nr:hypothetical protein BGZ81_004732 [Podila clonocystis]
MSSSTNLASNATTTWTIGQQRTGNRINAMPTDGTFVNHTGITVTTEPLSQLLAPKSTHGQSQGQGYAQGDVPAVVSAAEESSHASPHSARSTFLRAIGKFRNKHQQKRSAPSVATSGNSASAPSVPDSTASSFVLPPMQFEHTVSMESDRSAAYSNAGTVSMISFADSSRTKDGPSLELQDIDMEDSPHTQLTPVTSLAPPRAKTEGASGPSLRTKFKNKVNSTLASIKSSSNLKDKSRSQPSSQSSPTTLGTSSPYGSSQVSPTTIATSTSQYDSSSPTTPTTPSVPSKSAKVSKPFWTFPRSRPESEASKLLPWGDTARPCSYSGNSAQETYSHAQDAVMVSPELGPTEGHTIFQALGDVKSDKDVDSDDSIDIIMPGDYNDYTPFAELSAKKRKKMEAAAAAATAATAKESLKKPHAMKRLLEKGKKKDQSHKSSAISSTYERTESLTKTLQPRNSKKRPKDQDSIEQSQGQEPNKVAKGNSEEPPEWRRALMKSLHLGRNKARRISKDDTPDASQDGQGQGGDGSGARPRRSDSITSIRSRSLTTSTHAALLATTIPKPRGTALRRETLEMAMRRRRRSSAARSNLFVDDVPMPGSARNSIYGDANITHTFTSFTFELADMYAHDVVNNSATPGLFNFKRPPRLSISAPGADTSHEFQGFDSDGDALSGYTGDADISMEEIFVRPRTPSAASVKFDSRDKGKSRDSGVNMSTTAPGRRKLSIIDAESDTVPELPTLTIRTRDLNRSNSGLGRSGSYGRSQLMENSGESPRSPPRRASGNTASPTLHRKPSRNLASAYNAGASPASSKATPALSLDEVVTWKPRNILQQTPPRPPVPAVDTTKPALSSRGSGLSSSTTLIPSSRTPYSANSSAFAHSPGLTQFVTKSTVEPYPLQLAATPRHQRQPSLQYVQSQHQQQPSADTLLPQHLKNFSTASTLSASSGYSAQTLTSHSGLSAISQPVEFDPSQKFPTTPVDLKTMDFEALLQMAEQEQRKGWSEPSLQKKSATPTPRLSVEAGSPSPSSPTTSSVGKDGASSALSQGLHVVKNKGLSNQAVSAPNLETLGRQANNNNSAQSSPSNSSKGSGIHQLYTNSRALPKSATTGTHQLPQGRINSGVAFDLGPEGHNRSSQPRSKRVMKKKMSVIKLSGAVQGGRDHDGVIRVSVSSSGDPNQWRSS